MDGVKLLIIYMALVRAGYAQESKYPMLSIDSNKDTVVTISMPQLKKLNIQLIGLEECNEASDSTESALKSCLVLNEEKSKVIRQYVQMTNKQDSILHQDVLLFQGQQKIISDYNKLDKLHLQNEKSLKAKVVGFKIGMGLSIGGCLALLVFLK